MVVNASFKTETVLMCNKQMPREDTADVLARVRARMTRSPMARVSDVSGYMSTPNELNCAFESISDEIADNTAALHFALRQIEVLQAKLHALEYDLGDSSLWQ